MSDSSSSYFRGRDGMPGPSSPLGRGAYFLGQLDAEAEQAKKIKALRARADAEVTQILERDPFLRYHVANQPVHPRENKDPMAIIAWEEVRQIAVAVHRQHGLTVPAEWMEPFSMPPKPAATPVHNRNPPPVKVSPPVRPAAVEKKRCGMWLRWW